MQIDLVSLKEKRHGIFSNKVFRNDNRRTYNNLIDRATMILRWYFQATVPLLIVGWYVYWMYNPLFESSLELCFIGFLKLHFLGQTHTPKLLTLRLHLQPTKKSISKPWCISLKDYFLKYSRWVVPPQCPFLFTGNKNNLMSYSVIDAQREEYLSHSLRNFFCFLLKQST